MRTSRIRGAVVLMAALLTAGCGSNVGGSAQPGEIDVRTLDVGKYATGPLEERFIYYPDLGKGFNLAATRLADKLANGSDIDPRLTYGTGMRAFIDPDKGNLLAKSSRAVLADNGMLFGAAASTAEKSVDSDGKLPDNITFAALTVVQFATEAAADKAAREMEAADFGVAAAANQPVTLSKYPAAHAHWRPDQPSLGSRLAHGKYVVDLVVGLPAPDLTQLTALTERAYDVQLGLLDGLAALSKEDALRLPYDPDDMLRRTLNPSGLGNPDTTSQYVSETHGFLNQLTDQAYWRHVFDENGVDRVANSTEMSNTTLLYRARDTAQARALAGLILTKAYPGATGAPSALPNAICGERTKKDNFYTKRYRCAVTYRRYVATVEGDQLADVHQRANAQYALLANSTW
ncbi:hypothetical protein AB0L82_24620 [Nocardia sp. NPDC052001]|uniref:DUF7373 family lipoprotein n=1 Tax=Nocardia sp. NPDC052001 TaxID=3154853 RepID=UPI003412364F